MNRLAAPFGQAATQAPQPMHSAASIDASATGLGIGIRLASGAPPVGAVMNPPTSTMRSNAARSTIRSLMIGNAAARHGSTTISSPLLEHAHVQLARGGAALRAVGLAVDHQRARAADALATVVVEDDGVLALLDQPLVEDVEQLEERCLVADLGDLVRLEATLLVGAVLAPDLQGQVGERGHL